MLDNDVAETGSDLQRHVASGDQVAAISAEVWDALAALDISTKCVIRVDRKRRFIGSFPGANCPQIDREIWGRLGGQRSGSRRVPSLTVLRGDHYTDTAAA